jgi:hypothetical protein
MAITIAKPKRCFVVIKRPGAERDSFPGEILRETNSHALVAHDKNREGEWFPFQSSITKVFSSRFAAERLEPKAVKVTNLVKILFRHA